MSDKKITELKKAEVVPSSQDLLVKISNIVATEVARIQVKQSSSQESLGLNGSKQINELLKSIDNIDEQQEKYSKRDAISKLSDDQILEVLSKYVGALTEEDQHKLLRSVLNDADELDSEQ